MTLIYFILILGIIIFIHELGHFLTAKLFGVHVYEFALGMGPKILNRKGKETEYSLRLLPIGGFVRIAGEDNDFDEKVPKGKQLSSKPWLQRLLVMGAGSFFNFLLAILIIFILALTLGSVSTKPYIGEAIKGYPAYEAGLRGNDLIISINGKKVKSYDEMVIDLYSIGNKDTTFKILKPDGSIKTYVVNPIKENKSFIYGITPSIKAEYGIIKAINYTAYKFTALIKTMGMSLSALVTGGISIDQFSGPVGVYDIVDDQVAAGIGNVAYFIAYLCINIGFINLLPLPALDGGKIFFLIIEKIKGSKVNPNVENTVHMIGFMLLIGLMILITFNDIFKLGG